MRPTLPRLAVFVAVVAIALWAGAVACGRSTPARSLLHVGDSLAVGTDPYLPGLLKGWTITTSAVVGRRSDEGLAALEELETPLPRVLVVSLGTNDQPSSVGDFAATIEAVAALAGSGRCVVWTTIARPPVGGASYDAFNRAIKAEAKASKRFRVVDWAAMVARHPEYLRADGVHAVASGYRARAAETARIVKRC